MVIKNCKKINNYNNNNNYINYYYYIIPIKIYNI